MDIDSLRSEINKVNTEILELINKRMEISGDIAKYKKEHGLPIFDSAREKEIIEEIKNSAKEGFKTETIEVYKTLINASKNYQHKVISDKKINLKVIDEIKSKRIAYQGVEGSYSFDACKQCFGDAELICVQSFEDVFKAIKEGVVEHGVIPIENSSTGTLFEIYDLLRKYGYYIVAEKIIKVEHNLMSVKGSSKEKITEIYSHPQAFMQCENYLFTMPHAKHISYFNTAISAKDISIWNDPTKAAIASSNAAKLYNLEIIEREINDNKNNYTRFIIIKKDFEIFRDANKVSIIFSLNNESGSLYHSLGIFAYNNLNLIKIESRPHPNQLWKYLFYADFEGNLSEGNINNTLSYIEQETQDFMLLGNYVAL